MASAKAESTWLNVTEVPQSPHVPQAQQEVDASHASLQDLQSPRQDELHDRLDSFRLPKKVELNHVTGNAVAASSSSAYLCLLGQV